MPTRAKFDDFVKLANFFYMTVGIRPYQEALHGEQRSLFLDTAFYVGIVNTNVMVLALVIFIMLALVNGNNFVEATMTMAYVGFVSVGEFKILSVWRKKRELTKFVRDMSAIFPQTEAEQSAYKLQQYLRQCRIITIGFALLYMALIWVYNLFAIMQYLIYERWLQVREVGQTLPYYCWLPWDWHDHWSFYVIYALQSYAGYMAAAGQIAADLLLCGMATQVVMHYDYVSTSIEQYEVKASENSASKDGNRRDMEFLQDIIAYHDKILSLSDMMNDVFGVPLLFNFLISSFVICFVGFQMSIGVDIETLFKLLLYLVSSTSQVYLICYYGQLLTDASYYVSVAAYKQKWFNANVPYKKMLLLIAVRAQKPAVLKATSYLSISRSTMTEIMQMSYKFFALLRTMYSN